jgi:ribose-phosphate pyrophosphokinase
MNAARGVYAAYPGTGLQVFGGTAGADLARKICAYLKIELGAAAVSRFPDGEMLVKLDADVRGNDCFVVQSTCPPTNDNLMELLIFIDCLRRASALRITAVIPYYGYARQDRKSEGRTPITAKLVANMLTTAGADRVLTMNLHADQIQGFFDIPLDHLTAAPVLTRHFMSRQLGDAVCVSPDLGNIKIGSVFATRLGSELAIVHKRRLSADSTKAVTLIGNVSGRRVVMFDDMITTAGTIAEAARVVREHGAKELYVGATHGVFAPPALRRLRDAQITEIVVTDTVPLSQEIHENLPNLTVLTVSDLIGEAIRRIHEHRSVSALFDLGDP